MTRPPRLVLGRPAALSFGAMTDEQEDRSPEATAGRLAGRAVGLLGVRLLRLRPVREAVRRAAEEVSAPAPPEGPEPPGSRPES